ncbi:hypothetical protein AWENTII_006197 [Aspergillus wentii]
MLLFRTQAAARQIMKVVWVEQCSHIAMVEKTGFNEDVVDGEEEQGEKRKKRTWRGSGQHKQRTTSFCSSASLPFFCSSSLMQNPHHLSFRHSPTTRATCLLPY